MFISLRGCRLHNLKNVDVDIPVGKVTVVCGPSGCGKSTLILDTLHGESKRRYLETLSPFASEILGGRRVIPLDSAEGLPASLAIGPTRGDAPAKASALSIAECDGALHTLFASIAKPACPVCGRPMEKTSREEIIRTVAGLEAGTKLQFMAAMDTAGQSLDKLSAVFLAQGFTRAIADGVQYSLADLLPGEKSLKPKEFYVVVDRIIVRDNTRTRIAEAVDSALRLTHTAVTVEISGKMKHFSTVPRCVNADDAEHRLAYGVQSGSAQASSTKASKSNTAKQASQAVSAADVKAPHGNATAQRRPLDFIALEPRSFSPYNSLCACERCNGTGTAIENDDRQEACPDCAGLRLKPASLNATAGNFTYRQILMTPFAELPGVLHGIFDGKIGANLKRTFDSLMSRIDAINELGIGYLTPGRSGKTLSGGEIQRLKLSSLSTGHLNGLLIVLDEPASGLHANDVDALWNVLQKVKDRGNTLVLIEHHPLIIARADYIVEMGPGAGEKGGEILFQGEAKDILANPESPTASWLRDLGEQASGIRSKNGSVAKKTANGDAIDVNKFQMFDMAPISADFPIGKFSVITGQSGSGKSTLLFENIARRAENGEFTTLGIQALSVLTTGDFHGNRRSSVLSATGLAASLRDLFAKLPESKVRGYTATKFGINTPGGRCENCKGEGIVFDPSGYEETECPVCMGRRFRDEVLEVRFKSLSIADILDMEIGKAYKLFTNIKPIADKLKPLVDTGLDYLRLGQSTAHLSGGERARLRLSISLARAKAPNTLFLFDEPARGLHQKDIQLLLRLIHELCDAGHTVIAIEHAPDFVRDADYSIELSRM